MAKKRPSSSRRAIASSIPQKPYLVGVDSEYDKSDSDHTGVDSPEYSYLEKRENRTLETTSDEWDDSVHDLTVPIKLPNRKELSQKMVPLYLLNELDEVRKDSDRFFNYSIFFAGGILGIIINWVTSDPIIFSKASIVAIIALFLMTIIFGYVHWDMNKRVLAKEKSLRDLYIERS